MCKWVSLLLSHERVIDNHLKFIRSFLLHTYPINKGVGNLELFGYYCQKDCQEPARLTKDSILERICEQCHWSVLHSELLSLEFEKKKILYPDAETSGSKEGVPLSSGAIKCLVYICVHELSFKSYNCERSSWLLLSGLIWLVFHAVRTMRQVGRSLQPSTHLSVPHKPIGVLK